MPSPLKIELCKRYRSKTPRKVCPKQLAVYPETPQSIPRGLYHAITPEPTGNSLTGSQTSGADAERTGICWKRSEQPRTISAGTNTALSYRQCRPIPTGADRLTAPTESARNDPTKPEQLATVSPRRIFQTLRSGDCTAGSLLPYCHARKCFLRFFCADFCELRLMLISCNS